MTCEHQDKVADLVLGRLERQDAARLGAHMNRCNACRETLALLCGSVSASRARSSLPPPGWLLERSTAEPARRSPLLRILLPAALVALAFAILSGRFAVEPPPEREGLGPVGLLRDRPKALTLPLPLHEGEIFLLLQEEGAPAYLWQARVPVQGRAGEWIEVTLPEDLPLEPERTYFWELRTAKDEPGPRWPFFVGR